MADATSVRINLLPHRAQKRAMRKRQFVSLLILFGIAALVVVGAVHFVLGNWVDRQNARNQLLVTENKKLDEQIKGIDKLRDEIQQVLSRKQVVENLQANRSEAVHLFDQLVRILPDGVYVSSVKQQSARVQVIGYAQSNARVSTLMRNIDASPWLAKPDLVEVRLVPVPGAKQGDSGRINQFTLNFMVKREAPEAAPAPVPGKAAAKGAPKT
jgi:type IV pilus assembly protein PilN